MKKYYLLSEAYARNCELNKDFVLEFKIFYLYYIFTYLLYFFIIISILNRINFGLKNADIIFNLNIACIKKFNFSPTIFN